MPEPQTFEELVATLQFSTDEKKLFDSTISKNPTLKSGWMRQGDYSRKLNELTEKERAAEAKQAEAVAERERLDDWADKTIPVWETLVEKGIVDKDGNEVWTTKEADYKRQVEEARAAAIGGDMKPEDLQKMVSDTVKAAGGATKEEVEALTLAAAKTAAATAFEDGWKSKETKFNEETIPFVAGFSASAGIVAMRYEKETGEKWTEDKQKEMYALMSAKKDFNPFKVEDDLLKPFRDKKATESEVEKRVKEELSKHRRAETGGEGDYIPQPDAPKGALAMMLERSADKGTDTNALIMEKAREAGGLLRQEGKVGV